MGAKVSTMNRHDVVGSYSNLKFKMQMSSGFDFNIIIKTRRNTNHTLQDGKYVQGKYIYNIYFWIYEINDDFVEEMQ